MKKIILTLTIGLTISLFSSKNFEDKHLRCTLIEKDGKEIYSREAEGWNEFKINVFVTATTMNINNNIYTYDKDGDYIQGELFKVHLFDEYYGKGRGNITIEKRYKYDYSLGKLEPFYESFKKYECTEATLLEKLKYKFSK